MRLAEGTNPYPDSGVVMASLDGSTPVETLLAAIHLERYLDSFKRASLLLARDFTHLDHDALISLGVTATGHRKRILRLVHLIQRQKTDNPRGRCQSMTESGWSTTASRNSAGLSKSSTPDLSSMSDDPDTSRQPVKPVPKPRTVFNRSRTVPVNFCPSPDPAPPPDKRQSQESICLTVLEDVSSDTPTAENSQASEATPKHSQRQRQAGRTRPSRSLSLCDSLGSLPPVPPRLNRRAVVSMSPPSSSPSSSSPVRSDQRPVLSSQSFRSDSLDSSRLSGSPPSGSPRGPGVEMVSNEIYWGSSPVSTAPNGGRRYCSQQSAPPTPPRNTPERNREDRASTLSNNSSGSARASTDDPDEEISPYCETVYQSRRPPHNSENERSRGDEREMKMDERGTQRHTEDHGTHKLSWTKRLSQAFHSGDSQGYSTVGEAPLPPSCLSLPASTFADADEDLTISPYASYTSLSERAPPILTGWLDKLSPQGNYVFQKRFVKFDGKNLMYFGSEKDIYPRGVIPLAAIQMARLAKDNKFEIVTSNRIFVFRTDNEVLRRRWVTTLQEHIRDQLVFGRRRFGPGSHCQKHGVLELKGTKSKVYTAISTDQIWLHKSEQCFRNGIGITVIEARGATIRDGKHRSFDLITPYKSFSFTAESERDKRDWMEALQEAIAETLSDYEVAEKIWSNRSNRMCADCKAVNPDWASINLCVVICKNCAGQHRSLGSMVSKVQSLKLDTSVWSNEIVQLFIMVGNDRANDFWAAHLSQSEELDCDASPEQRKDFITQKYKEGRFRLAHPAFSTHEELLKALCTALSEQTLLKTVTQIFLEAESARLTGDSRRQHDAPQGYSPSTDPGVYDEIMQSVLHSGFLYKCSSVSRGTISRKNREDFQKFWCVVDQYLLLYESEQSSEPSLQINLKDMVCLGVCRPDSSSNSGFIDRFRYTFELYLTSEKLYQFGLETAESLHSWTKAIGKAATPLSCHCLLTREFERVGLLRYRAMLDPQQWKDAYFVLQKSNLFICPRNDGAAEDIINLKRLQELSVASENDNQEKKDILVLVEKGRTLHLHAIGRMDFSLWYSDIQRAAGGRGNTLREQQMRRHSADLVNLPEEPIKEEEEEEEEEDASDEDMDSDDRVVEFKDKGGSSRSGGAGLRSSAERSPSPWSESDEMDYDLELKMISTPSPKKSKKMTMYADEVESHLKSIRNRIGTSGTQSRAKSSSPSKLTDVRQLLLEKRQGLSHHRQPPPVASGGKTDVRQRLGKRRYSPDRRRTPSPASPRDTPPSKEPVRDVHSRLGVAGQDRGVFSSSKDRKTGDLWSRLGNIERRGSDHSAPSSSSSGRKEGSGRAGKKAEGEEKEEEEDDSMLQKMWGAMIKQKQERLGHKGKKSRLDSLPSLQIEISRDSSDDSDA